MKGNMNMVNLALLVVILILVVYCLVTSNKENFNLFYAAPYPHAFKQRITNGGPQALSDTFSKTVLNDDDNVMLDSQGNPVTTMVNRRSKPIFQQDAGQQINYTKDGKVYTLEQGDSIDNGTLFYDTTLGHPIIIPPKNKISDYQEFLKYRLNNMSTESTNMYEPTTASTNMYEPSIPSTNMPEPMYAATTAASTNMYNSTNNNTRCIRNAVGKMNKVCNAADKTYCTLTEFLNNITECDDAINSAFTNSVTQTSG